MVGDDAKVCMGCGQTKPLDDYYRNKGGLAGRQSRCKPCFKKQILAPTNYRERQNARHAVRYAIQTGKMVRPDTCSACGSFCNAHAHHDDYTKRLDVRWLCKPCHEEVHRGQKYERRTA